MISTYPLNVLNRGRNARAQTLRVKKRSPIEDCSHVISILLILAASAQTETPPMRLLFCAKGTPVAAQENLNSEVAHEFRLTAGKSVEAAARHKQRD